MHWSRSVSCLLVPGGTALFQPGHGGHTPPGGLPDLVLQMPRKLHQPELVELPISLRQPQDLMPPACSPLLGDNNPYGSLKHYFLFWPFGR